MSGVFDKEVNRMNGIKENGLIQENENPDNYSFDDYIKEIDMELLFEIQEKHPIYESFDYFHGLITGLAINPLDVKEINFAGTVSSRITESPEERKKYSEAVDMFIDATRKLVYSKKFVPFCKNWEYKNAEENNPAEWCNGFLLAVDLFMAITEVNNKLFVEFMKDHLFPFFAFASKDDLEAKREKLLKDNGLKIEDFRSDSFKELPNMVLEICYDMYDLLDEIKYQIQHSPKISNKIGRNDLCPCGSGKKYKKCCESTPSKMI